MTKGSTRLVTGTRTELPTIYDLVSNLSGRPIPEISHGHLLPADPHKRAHQLKWQNDVIITILAAQGAKFNSMKGEQLLDWQDYINYCNAEKIRQGARFPMYFACHFVVKFDLLAIFSNLTEINS